METPFDKKANKLVVQVDEIFYRNNEIIVYFSEILNSLLAQNKSLKNKLQYINMAKILINKREFRKASSVVFQGLARFPNDMELMRLRVEIFIYLKDFENALKTADEALKEDPYNISIMMMKAKIFATLQDEDAEEKVYLESIKIPKFDYLTERSKIVARRHLANIYLKQKRYQEAEKLVEEILIKSPDDPIWAMYFTILMRMGKHEESEKAREKFARFKRARVYFDIGAEYEAKGKFNLALASYRDGLEIYPDDPLVNAKVGNILMFKRKWYSKAYIYLKKAVELYPDQASYRSSFAMCLKNQGKYQEAFEEAKTAELMDHLSNIHILKRLAFKLGKEKELEEIIQKNIENDPESFSPSLRYELALLYKRFGRQEEASKYFQQAIDMFSRRIQSFPEEWGIYVDLGYCFKELSEFDKAESFYKMAEQVKGVDLEEVYEKLVELYQESHQMGKKSAYLLKLIKIHPTKFVNYLDLGANFLSSLTSSMRKKVKNEE